MKTIGIIPARYASTRLPPVVMTSPSHPTGAERMQEVSENLKADFYVQINGDEPFIDGSTVQAAVPKEVPKDREFGTNIITKMQDPAQVLDPTNIKMVFDDKMNALYMSRTPIPYPYKEIGYSYYKHVGIIIRTPFQEGGSGSKGSIRCAF